MQKRVLFFLWGLAMMALIVARLRASGPRFEMRSPANVNKSNPSPAVTEEGQVVTE